MNEATVENTPTGNVMSSITSDGFTVESNFETPEQLRSGLGIEESGEKADAKVAPAVEPKRRNRRDDPRIAVEAATGKAAEAERLRKVSEDEAVALRAELAELKKPKPVAVQQPVAQPQVQQPAAQPVQQPATVADYKRYQAMPDAPKIETFQTIEEYQFAVSHFIASKMYQEQSQQTARQQAEQHAYAAFNANLTEGKARIPDFDQRFNPATPVDTRIWPTIAKLKNVAEVLVYLSDHQDEAQRLTTLHPMDQIGEIGEIAGTLKAQAAAAVFPASARPAISQAKPPAKRVSGAPPAAVDEPPDDDASDEAHDAYWKPRRQELHTRRHR